MELPALFSFSRYLFSLVGTFVSPISNTLFGKIHCANIFKSPRLAMGQTGSDFYHRKSSLKSFSEKQTNKQKIRQIFQWLPVVLQTKTHEVLHGALCPSCRFISHQTPLCSGIFNMICLLSVSFLPGSLLPWGLCTCYFLHQKCSSFSWLPKLI